MGCATDKRNYQTGNSQYEFQSQYFAPVGREILALKPENRSPKVSGFRTEFQNENCCHQTQDEPTEN